jgi:hypothetical protein
MMTLAHADSIVCTSNAISLGNKYAKHDCNQPFWITLHHGWNIDKQNLMSHLRNMRLS